MERKLSSEYTYSSSALRSFRSFIGELTAVAAGIYVGVQEAVPQIEATESLDPWELAAKKYDVKVSGLKSERVVVSAIRMSLVSLYSGFDLFLSNTKSQFRLLHGKEWSRGDGDTPFQALARNTPSTTQEHEDRLCKGNIATLDYYRLVRNSIAHPKPDVAMGARKFYEGNKDMLKATALAYGMKSTPSDICDLSFHDIKYLARVSLDLASAIDLDFYPGEERLAVLLPEKFYRLQKTEKRRHNAMKGWLSEHYGIDSLQAEKIISMRKTH